MTVFLKRLYSQQRLILLLRERDRETERQRQREICLCTPRKFVLFSVGTKNMVQRSLIVPGWKISEMS